MTLLLIALIFGFIFEFFVYTSKKVWRDHATRSFISAISILLTSFALAGMFALELTVIMGFIVLIGLLRIVNMLRITKGRLNDLYLRRVAFRSSIILGVTQLLAFAIRWALQQWVVTAHWWLIVLAITQLTIAVFILLHTIRRISHTRLIFEPDSIASTDLPTLTVAIPARNETDDLHHCLESLVRSDYPKLEILVLDDCSQFKRTPAIIRDFAQAGVRFIRGEVPEETWLAKNYAYDRLSKEASGELLLFCGVDIRFEPTTLRQLVQTMVLKKKRMMSLLPLRYEPSRAQASLAQAARYIWELTPPRRLFRRPPVLSSCWLIYRKDLIEIGGFAAVRRAIVPEALFARSIIKRGDFYSFLRSNTKLGLWSAKTLANQRETATRVRYPSLHRRPEVVFFISLLYLVILLGSPAMAVLYLFGGVPHDVALVSFIATVFFLATYCIVTISTKVNSWYLAPILAVPAIIYDILLMYRSMWLYEFGEVLWKGRNVCAPVMHVIPDLPKLPR